MDKDGFWEGEVEHTTKDGKLLYIKSRCQFMLDDWGNTVVLETNHDITERKNVEKQNLEFLSLISHEFKTPINVIHSAVQVIEQFPHDEIVLHGHSRLSADGVNIE